MILKTKLPCATCESLCENALRLYQLGKVFDGISLGIKCPKDGKTYHAERKGGGNKE